MAIAQPISTDPLNSPDHSALHRIIAADVAAPAQSLTIPASGNLAGTCLQNTNPTNLLSNGDFENWSAGTTVAPDGWTKTGVGSSIAREGTIIKLGTYSAKLTRVTNDTTIYQSVHSTRGIEYWKGRKITFGCWVYATVASRALVNISDNIGDSASSYHTGNSTWQWLSVTRTIDASANTIDLYCKITSDDTAAYFDGAMCVEGESAFAFADKPLPRGGTIAAEVDETKFSHKIPVYLDGALYYIMLTQT